LRDEKRCESDKSLKRSQLNFTAIIHARKATNPENFAKIGCVLSEIIASKQQKKTGSSFSSYGHPRSLKMVSFDFLFDFQNNYIAISCRFGDIA